MAKQWTPEDDRFLFENYDSHSLKQWAERFGATKKAISNKMNKLRKKFSQEPEKKSEEMQEAKPAQKEERLPQKQLVPADDELLFDHGKDNKKTKQWTPEDDRFLFDNYNSRSLIEWAEHFGTTKKAISNKMSKLRKIFSQEPEKKSIEGLKDEPIQEEKRLLPKQWSPEEEKLLFAHYREYPVEEWAKRFDVTKKAVINKMSSLRKKITQKEESIVKFKKERPSPPKKYKLVPSPYEIKMEDGWQRIMMRVVDESA